MLCLGYERVRYGLLHPESASRATRFRTRSALRIAQRLRRARSTSCATGRCSAAADEAASAVRPAVEFVAPACCSCRLAFGALIAYAAASTGGRSAASWRTTSSCAVTGRCDAPRGRSSRLRRPRRRRRCARSPRTSSTSAGERQLPVDWRDCRRVRLRVRAGRSGTRRPPERTPRHRATAFTRVIRRGGRLYIQYWLYYPDSNTALAGSDRLWERSWLLPRLRELVAGTPDYPGYHRDDWEGAFVRVDPDGSTWVRASSHGHFQGCKWRSCRDAGPRGAGWVRVSRGSHSGHVPFRRTPAAEAAGTAPLRATSRGRLRGRPRCGASLRSRAATSASAAPPARACASIPLETHDHRRYRPLDPDIAAAVAQGGVRGSGERASRERGSARRRGPALTSRRLDDVKGAGPGVWRPVSRGSASREGGAGARRGRRARRRVARRRARARSRARRTGTRAARSTSSAPRPAR